MLRAPRLALAASLAVACATPREPARPAAAGSGSAVTAAAAATAATTATTAEPLSESRLAADLAWLAAPERAGRGSTSPEARATARWLAGELRAAGYAPVEQPIPDAPGQVNVIAAAPAPAGTSAAAPSAAAPATPAVLVVAHYDHLGVRGGALHPGADDNASGVAVALAVARDLARRPAAGRVVFLFTGAEEIGLRGARAFVAAPAPPLAELRAVFNLDMVGRAVADGDAPPQLAGVGLSADPDVTDAALDAAAAAGLALVPVPSALVRAVGQAERSDDAPFRDAGVYAVHFSTGVGEGYHSPRDTLDGVSVPQLLRVSRFLRGLITRTAG